MKRIIFMAIASIMMFASAPVFAADAATDKKKDECLLVSKECKEIINSVQTKAEKLKVEIEKGSKVYTPEEIKTLKNKLKEAEIILDNYLND